MGSTKLAELKPWQQVSHSVSVGKPYQVSHSVSVGKAYQVSRSVSV